MFQYAFGLRTAQALQQELKLSKLILESKLAAQLRNFTHRQYELDVFGLNVPFASTSETLSSLILATLPGSRSFILREQSNVESILSLMLHSAKSVLCWGYWQSENWFKPIAPLLRQQFIFQRPLSPRSQQYAEAIQRSHNAVFIHIRRGDYVSNPNANKHHGFIGEIYYRKAIDQMHQQLDAPEFFVFSDDMGWVRSNLGPAMSSATYIEGNTGANSWQDMYLMSLCQFAIIANSSFSWWGAWLNPSTTKTVIAPKQWFASPNVSSKTIVPENWLLL
ncbi:alpha-1,2-fucosyltransferase [Nibrella saemangeumensis]